MESFIAELKLHILINIFALQIVLSTGFMFGIVREVIDTARLAYAANKIRRNR